MRRLLILCLLCLLPLLFGCSEPEPAAAPPEDPAQTPAVSTEKLTVGVVCNGEVINIRRQPGTDSRILDTARRGDLFQVLESGVEGSDDNTWARINYRGANAYISESYLSLSQWESGQTAILARAVNSDDPPKIRAAALPDAAVLYSMSRGEVLLVVGKDAALGWHEVFYPDKPAFVASDQVELTSTTIDQALFQ